jgi:hypothetical protein
MSVSVAAICHGVCAQPTRIEAAPMPKKKTAIIPRRLQ